MRFLLILLLGSILKPNQQSLEEILCFALMYEGLLDQTTHVIYANVINETGDLEIIETWYGENMPKELYFKELSRSGRLCKLEPPGKISDWEVVMLLSKRPRKQIFDPAFFYYYDEPLDIEEFWKKDDRSCWLGISTVWVKNGIVYTQIQNDYELHFIKWDTFSNFKKQILKDFLKKELLD